MDEATAALGTDVIASLSTAQVRAITASAVGLAVKNSPLVASKPKPSACQVVVRKVKAVVFGAGVTGLT